MSRFFVMLCCVCMSLVMQAQITHEFFFNSNFNSNGTGQPLTEVFSCGATAGGFSSVDIITSGGLCSNATAFCFNEGGGLHYPNNGITGQYSINLFFKFNALGGWSRVIDFSNGTADAGFYLLNNCLNFYPNGNVGTCPFFQPGIFYLFTFVRDGNTNVISVYVNGTLFGSYTDVGNIYRPATATTPVIFFRDDAVVSCEDKAGCIKYASVSSGLLTAAQVDSIWQNICIIATDQCKAKISYDGSPFSSEVSSPQPVTFEGYAGGTYSAEAGLSIDSLTGAIVPSESIPGTYTVTYTMDAICNNRTSSSTVTIVPFSGECRPEGDMLVFASKGGGRLNIHIDRDIPGLKIGVLSKEPAQVTLSGPYAQQVTQVLWTGAPGFGNDRCDPDLTESNISGPRPENYLITYLPPAGIFNPNGEETLFCATSCNNNSYQEGCNTIDQVVYYFTETLGGELYALSVQSCCWNDSLVYTLTGLSGQCCSSAGMAAIAYPREAYCRDSSISPVPVVTGTEGGIFSASGGLVIDPLSGTIDPANSLPGDYIVWYTLPGCPSFTTGTQVSVSDAAVPPAAQFSYEEGAAPYEIRFSGHSSLADEYFWDFGDGNTSTLANPVFIFPYEGTWPVTFIIGNGCGSDTLTTGVVVLKSGFNELPGIERLTLSPNPGNRWLQISGKSPWPQELEIQLYAVTGQLLTGRSLFVKDMFTCRLSADELSNGIYFIVVTTASGVRKTLRWVKE